MNSKHFYNYIENIFTTNYQNDDRKCFYNYIETYSRKKPSEGISLAPVQMSRNEGCFLHILSRNSGIPLNLLKPKVRDKVFRLSNFLNNYKDF